MLIYKKTAYISAFISKLVIELKKILMMLFFKNIQLPASVLDRT